MEHCKNRELISGDFDEGYGQFHYDLDNEVGSRSQIVLYEKVGIQELEGEGSYIYMTYIDIHFL